MAYSDQADRRFRFKGRTVPIHDRRGAWRVIEKRHWVNTGRYVHRQSLREAVARALPMDIVIGHEQL